MAQPAPIQLMPLISRTLRSFALLTGGFCLVITSPALISAAEAQRPLNIPLGQGITLTEVDSDNKPHDLLNIADTHVIDVNSTLLIRIDPLALATAMPRPVTPRGDTMPLDVRTLERRQKLLDTLSILNDYLRVSEKIAVLFSQNLSTRSIPGLDELTSQHGNLYLGLQGKLEEYLAVGSDPNSAGKSPQDMVDDIFDGPVAQWTVKVRDFIQGEVRRLDGASARRLVDINSNSNPFSLQLTAHLIRNGERIGRIHLPGYDDVEEGEIRPIDKISFSMSEKEKAGLQTELEFHRNLSNRLKETQNLRQGLEL